MRLFEEFNNRRYNLQESIDEKGNITPEPGDIAKEKSILRNRRKIVKRQSQLQNRNIKSNTQAGEQLKKEISRRLSASTTKGDQARSLYGTGGGSTEGAGGANTGTTKPNVDDSVKSVRTNRRNINKVTQPNVVQGSGSGTTANKGGGATTSTNKNIVNKPSTEYRQLQNKARGILKDLSKEKPVSQNVVRPKLNYDLIGNKLDGKTGNQIFQQNKISNTPSGKTKIELPKFSQQSVNKAGGSSQTFIKPKNFSQFRTGSATLNRVKPLTKFARRLGVAGAVADAGLSGYQSYSDSQKKGDSKLKSLGRSAATVAGGVLGGIGGAALASPIPIPGARIAGGFAGYQYGKDYATKAYDALTTRKGRMKFKDFIANVGSSTASKK